MPLVSIEIRMGRPGTATSVRTYPRLAARWDARGTAPLGDVIPPQADAGRLDEAGPGRPRPSRSAGHQTRVPVEGGSLMNAGGGRATLQRASYLDPKAFPMRLRLPATVLATAALALPASAGATPVTQHLAAGQ